MTTTETIQFALNKVQPYFKGFSIKFIKVEESKIHLQFVNINSSLDHIILPKLALETYLSEELNQIIEVIIVE